MPTCKARKTDGEPCQGHCQIDSEYCSYHHRKYASSVKHGRSAQASLLGIPKQHHMTYEEFVRAEKPFDLKMELAYLRTLLVELREAMEAQRPDPFAQFSGRFREALNSNLIAKKLKPEFAEVVSDMAVGLLRVPFESVYGEVRPIDEGQARSLANLVDNITRAAERMKKIQEDTTVHLDVNSAILMAFLKECVFRAVPHSDTRRKIMSLARGFSLGPGRHDQMRSAVVVDVEPEETVDIEAEVEL